MSNVTPSTILIVDDTPANLNILFDFLRESGFKVLVAQSGESALQKVEYAKPDLILLDILMPEMDGFETCRILKAQSSTQDIPIIFMTALSETVDKVKGLRLGAVDYITKPFQQEEVLARIQLHLNLCNLTRKVQEQNTQLEQQIQERLRAEERLQQREAQLRLITDALPVMISYIDYDHRYRFFNRGYEDWFQRPREELINCHVRDLLGETLYQELLPNLVLAFSGQTVTFENVLPRADRLHHLEITYVPHFNKTKVQGAFVLAQDVTERKQLERQLLRSQRMDSLGTLASGIAHDLNNILTPILMSVQLLAMKYHDDQSQLWLELLETNTKRGADLIRQVMLFVRGVEGKHTLIEPKHLLLELKQMIEETFPRSIKITTHFAPDLWSVSGDLTQLHQVLMNLCVNARDAMPQGGHLQLSIENIELDAAFVQAYPEAKVGPYILFKVTDTGMGIPLDIIDRIFEPFFTTKEFGQGTGLGLSTVVGIVKSHGGLITVTSTISQGTQFQIFLPAIAPTSTTQLGANELPSGNGETILVVDDEASIREIAQTVLETHGYQTLTANDGVEAIALYVKYPHDIDLVIVDMMMPSMDGWLAIRALKEINPQVRILAMSGLITNDLSVEVSEVRDQNLLGFLPKPFTTQELLTILKTALSR